MILYNLYICSCIALRSLNLAQPISWIRYFDVMEGLENGVFMIDTGWRVADIEIIIAINKR